MVKKRKITCDCGKQLEEKTTLFGHIQTEAMVCPSCQFTTLTKKQAEKYLRLREFHRIIDTERKIIKVGNSMGITLPDGLKEWGIKAGTKVRTEALSQNSFKVELV
jgi:hypothetical protein